MKYFISFLLIVMIWLIGTSLYMYDIKNDGHNHANIQAPHFENVVVDARHSFLGLDPDQVVCYRESHRNFYIFTLILMASVLGLIAYGFIVQRTLSRSLRKKNGEIEAQKTIIQTTNENLISSIRYASQVQQSFLPTAQVLKSRFSEHFVINQPRDMVSGDFYWSGEYHGSKLLCVGDCTGHGVPGALLTMHAFNLLNQLTHKYINEPGQLMDELHQRLVSQLERDGDHVTDGMDLSLLIFDADGKTLKMVSAHQTLWILRNGTLIEFKGERRGLGPSYAEITKPFTVQTFDLHEGDTIFGFSDGFTDQFGGPESKKFSKKRLGELLISTAGQTVEMAREAVIQAFDDWKGNTPQTDDMLMVCVRV